MSKTSVQNRNGTASCHCAAGPCPGYNCDCPPCNYFPPPPPFFVFGNEFWDMRTFFTRGYGEAGTAEKVVVGKPSSLGKSARSYSAPELMVYLNIMGFGGRPLVLGPTVYTYVKYDHFEHFRASKCQHFERKAHTLSSLMMQSNALKGFPSVPC